MGEFLQSMTLPFLACLLLVGIHVYLGIHVIARKVIFVDLALAQIAAFGAVYGVILGYGFHEDPWAIKGFSLLFTCFGAGIFTLTRQRHERVPHEAIIGITYAVTLAGTILASIRLPHGSDELRDLLSGAILWVRGDVLIASAGTYLLVGIFHYLCRRPFLQISFHPEQAIEEGRRIHLWDFLFYLSFGIVVTTSVVIAGVLLVFSYLVIPAVIAVLFATSVRSRLILGWTLGTVVSLIGVTASYQWDLPSGPTIVVSLGGSLLLAGAIYFVLHSRTPARSVLRLAAGGAATALLLCLPAVLFRRLPQEDPLAMLDSKHAHERLVALQRAEDDPHLWQRIVSRVPALLKDPEPKLREETVRLVGQHRRLDLLPSLPKLLEDADDSVREATLNALRANGDGRGYVDDLAKAAAAEDDDYLRVHIADTLLELGDPRGVPVLIDVVEEGDAPQARADAVDSLRAHVPGAPLPPPSGNLPPRGLGKRLKSWWQENHSKLSWRPQEHRFE